MRRPSHISLNRLLVKHNGRFIIKNDVTPLNNIFFIYDNHKNRYIISLENYSVPLIADKIDEYVITERNNKINKLGL